MKKNATEVPASLELYRSRRRGKIPKTLMILTGKFCLTTHLVEIKLPCVQTVLGILTKNLVQGFLDSRLRGKDIVLLEPLNVRKGTEFSI